MKYILRHFFFISFILPAVVLSAQPTACNKNDLALFQKLYIDLQNKLNYEGSDAFLKNGLVKEKPHAKGSAYGGKVFEDALYKEYQNSLRKVAMLYQNSKWENSGIKSNSSLAEFFKAIDSADSNAFIMNNDIKKVIENLEKASKEKYTAENDKKFILNENDKYLLEKMLTHAQDRIVSVQEFEKNNKDQRHFKKDYLKKVANAPLNRLITVLKNANIKAESNIADTITEIAADKTAMTSAITANINDLKKWLKENKHCAHKIKNPGFIQSNIQIKNYHKFLDALTCSSIETTPLDKLNAANLVAVLHFINANEKFLNKPGAKAETAMDELKLEAAIDETFKKLGSHISCSKVLGENGKNKYFVQNLPYADNKFDMSKIKCKKGGTKLNESVCSQSIKLVSDPLGRGIEIVKKNEKGPELTFSIENGTEDCRDISTGEPEQDSTTPPKETKTQAQCDELGKAENKKYKLDTEKNECVESKEPAAETKAPQLSAEEEKCIKDDLDEKGNRKNLKIWNAEKKLCEDKPAAKPDPAAAQVSKEEEECYKKDRDETGLRTNKFIWNSEQKKCISKESQESKTDPSGDLDMPVSYAPKAAPSRFVPVNIPTRQMYILPGMP